MANKARQSRSTTWPVRHGMTLVEMMVSMVITLIMIFALAQAFQTVSATISYNRSTIEMASQLRSTSVLLQRDLEGLTVSTLPLADPSSNSGYFEYVERQDKDYQTSDTDTSIGDIDDVLMFTSRSANAPYTGLFNGAVVESPDAEIIWWVAERDYNGDSVIDADERFVYRRVLVIRPDLDGRGSLLKNPVDPTVPHWPKTFSNNAAGLAALRSTLWNFHNDNDISVRLRWVISGSDVIVNLTANSLSDLAGRENRFAHYPIIVELSPIRLVNNTDFPTFKAYPFVLDVNPISITSLDRLRYFGRRIGEDVVLQNALAFDVRAYDVTAQVRAHPGEDGAWGVASLDDDGDGTTDNVTEAGWADSDDETVTPGDRGFASAARIGTGAYVDLYYNSVFNYVDGNGNLINSSFSGSPHVRSGLSGRSSAAIRFVQPLQATWDSWSLHYEADGINQDGTAPRPSFPLMPRTIIDTVTDEGANGFDDDGSNGVDDPGERETSPPYNVALRGIQIGMRIMETDNRLVRQSSVVINFIPE